MTVHTIHLSNLPSGITSAQLLWQLRRHNDLKDFFKAPYREGTLDVQVYDGETARVAVVKGLSCDFANLVLAFSKVGLWSNPKTKMLKYKILVKADKGEPGDHFARTSISLAKREYETFCISDFYRFPVEMREQIVSLLPRRDLISLRSVCKASAAIIPVSFLVKYLLNVSHGKKTLQDVSSYDKLPTWLYVASQVIDCPLAEISAGLLSDTIWHLQLCNKVYADDISTIVDQCNQLHTIDIKYPTDETKEVLKRLVQNNKDTLRTFSFGVYSDRFAFDCAILQPCRYIKTLIFNVKNVKNIEWIPRSLTYLKLEKISLSQVDWIGENLHHLKFLQFQVEHIHTQNDKNIAGQLFCDDNYLLLKKICNLEKIEGLDLNFSVNIKNWNYNPTPIRCDVCPTVRRFHKICKVPGIAGVSDNLNCICSLCLKIDRATFVPFKI